MGTITARYEWYGEMKTVQLTPRNHGHRFQYGGATYHVERDAKRRSKWNVYRVNWGDGGRLIAVVGLAPSRKQAIADTIFQAMSDAFGDED